MASKRGSVPRLGTQHLRPSIIARMSDWLRCPELDGRSPLSVMAAWPRDTPLAMLHTNPSDSLGRWSILAAPSGFLEAWANGGRWIGPKNLEMERAAAQGAIAALEAVDKARSKIEYVEGHPPFSEWITCLHYELGAILEPVACDTPPACDESVLTLLHCPDAIVHDRVSNSWWKTGHPPLPCLDSQLGDPMRADGCPSSTPTTTEWPAAVAKAVEYVRAGDVFQVNLTRQLRVDVSGDTRAFGHAALSEPQTAFGAFVELPHCDRAIVSLSPELFLEVDCGGGVTSRPIKGTLPAAEHADTLADSAKDAAELHMIVDLMRNDLGRICTLGSVRVPCPRRIETYPTVHHGVSEICGVVRSDVTLVELLAATFPAGSITGAPKIRAMQIADALEPLPRGMYCGAVGFLGPEHSITLSVAIRTAVIDQVTTTPTLSYGVGCGIVAESTPMAELAESESKAHVLWRTLSQSCETPVVAAEDQQSPA